MASQGIKATLAAMQKSPQALNRACLITGAADRLGKEIALAMARAGWDVAVHYKNSAQKAKQTADEIAGLGRQAITLNADLDDAVQVERLFEMAWEQFPHLSCVINNASRFEFDSPQTFGAEKLNSHMAANLTAPLLLARGLYQKLEPKHQKGADPCGVVIHMLDQKLDNPNPDFFSYTLSKAALAESVRIGAMAFAPVLRVAGISPGITLASADQTKEEFQRTHAMTPLGASSRPHEVADAVVWLSQARAVTGTVILVDGGQHLAASPRDVMMMIR